MTRRGPRWVSEAVAWVGALVLIAGVAIVATGVIGEAPPKVVAVQTPVIQPAQVSPVKAPVKPAKPPPVRTNARGGVPVEPSLGPPPGPQHDPVPKAFAPPDKRFAFLVGVTDYRSPTKDTIAGANDVRFIRSMLLAAGWLPQNIKMVTNKAATGTATRSGLAWLVARSKPGTFTLFHFSGHVKQVGGREKLWPYDRDFVTDLELARLIKKGTGKTWVDIAGCEGGGFIEDLPSSRVLVSASSKVTQKSYEYPPWGESVWTGLVWDMALGQGQADANRDGRTVVGEALRYATYYAQAITLYQRPYGRQTPQVFGDPVRGWTLDNPPA